MIDPYRLLFPLGVLYAVAGALLWPLHASGILPYPGTTHRSIMLQGFEHCFILGFLLTAMSAFLHAGKCHPGELAGVVLGMILYGVGAFAGFAPLAHAGYAATILVVFVAAAHRIPRATAPPPEEFRLAGFGLVLGGGSAFLLLGASLGAWSEPWPGFGLRGISHGMILTLVLGVGGLLVPTFTAMSQPLVIPGIARPHERPPRRKLYAVIGAGLLVALCLDAIGRAVWGAWLRALLGSTMLLIVWKVARAPGRPDRLSFMLRFAGWCLFAGLWAAALVPGRPLLGAHLLFVGGFGFLTLGIATRIVVRHGGHALEEENALLSRATVGLAIAALVARIGVELWPARGILLAAVSGTAWAGSWIAWAAAALPRIVRLAKKAPAAAGPGPSGVSPRHLESPL